jgi:LytS/YehU family sensor histidine kinase
VLPIGSSDVYKILAYHSGAAIVASCLWIIIAKGLGLLLSRWIPGFDERVTPYLFHLFSSGVVLYLLAVSIHYVLLSFQTSRDAEMEAKEAMVFARDAEIKALKAQINPHFLFNSLNSISALATVDGARARDMCIRLSEFLRSTLSLGEKEMIPLSEELALARTYLGVEQIRFGARLKVEEQLDARCGRCQIPPLLIQPLVENAIKHGIAGLVEGGTIRLEASCENGWLRVRVRNEFDADAPTPRKSGLGLTNVRNRLRARYETQARLDTELKDNYFLAELTLPCDGHAHA